MDPLKRLLGCTGFEWDEGNAIKIWEKHRVSPSECEEAFFNRPLLVGPDEKHSGTEPHHYVLAHTDRGRRVFVVFTIRGTLIRVITARDMNRRERRLYERL